LIYLINVDVVIHKESVILPEKEIKKKRKEKKSKNKTNYASQE